MISFSKFKPRKTYWQFLVFNHNFFEIPEVIELSKKYEIYVDIKINKRPKFKINKKRLLIAQQLYQENKTEYSKFMFGW